MKYELKLSKKVEKFLAKHSEINEKIVQKLVVLQENPRDNTLDIKPMKG